MDLSLLIDAGAERALLALILLMARLVPLFWVAPMFGGRLVPAPVRVGLSLAIALLIFPSVAPALDGLSAMAPALVVMLVAKEVLVGFALGFVTSLVFHAAAAAGALVDGARGAQSAEATLPQSGARTTVLGNLHVQLAIVIFFALGGHRVFFVAVAHGYAAIPPAALPTIKGVASFGALCIRLSADVILVGLALAAPVVVALALGDLTLGWINRFAPQINVYFMAMPAKALLGIGVLAIAAPLLLAALPPLLSRAMEQLEIAARIFGP
ncbi:MAG: flagellar biosynthetic protein FliR [Myxococcales bacterium]|nr:flagellar biosynthetic protein FliR [Myxococcales bacterium]